MEKNHKPLIAMIFIQIIYAGMALFSKLAVSQGTNPFVFVFYRQAFASLALAPFAFFLESGKSYPLSFVLLVKIFLISLFGLTLSLNLYYIAINYTTATFAAATTNTIPSITFVLALLFRLETLSFKKSHGVAKVLGSVVGVSGAFVFAFVKGPSLLNQKSGEGASNDVVSMSTQDWLRGAITMLSANTSWCLWLVLQTMVMKEYPAKLRFVTLQCFFSCIQTALWGVVNSRDPSVWRLQFGLPLLSVVYCGIVVTGMTYWLQVWAIEKKGPVFTAMFTPLALILTSIISSILFKETLYLGSVGGAILLVGGLYSVLWGKTKEETDKSGEIQQQQQHQVELKEPNIVFDSISTQQE